MIRSSGGRYSAYGLGIRSEIPLSEFSSRAGGPDDVVVRIGKSAQWIETVRMHDEHLQILPGQARFWFKDAGAFTVAQGSAITVYPERDADLSFLRLYIQGLLMAMILHQRGLCVLHASVVEMDGSAVAFLGPVGAGKSSVAGALYARGYRVLSDDNAAVDLSTGVATVLPAYPCLKLFPAIASALGWANLETLHTSQQKLRGFVQKGYSPNALPLTRLYFLRRDAGRGLARLSPLNTLVELIRASVPTRWGQPGDARQMKQCGYLAANIEAFTLQTFSAPESVREVADAVIGHCAASGAPPSSATAAGCARS